MAEAQLQLHGWSAKRRVVIVRQRIRGGIARERHVDGKQLRLDLAGPSVHEGDRLWEYAVLVTDVAHPLESIGQLYRDRADAENAFDESKNQCGLGGFTTQHVKAAAEQFKDLDRWGCLLRCVSDRIAPAIGPPRTSPGIQATGYLPA